MVSDAALRGAFMSLFASLCVMVRDHVRSDCHQNSHQNYVRRTAYGRTALGPARADVAALPGAECGGSRKPSFWHQGEEKRSHDRKVATCKTHLFFSGRC